MFPNTNVPQQTAYGSIYIPDGTQAVPIYSAAGQDSDDIFVRTYTKRAYALHLTY